MAPAFATSESEADEADLRQRAQEDASVLYARPQLGRMKTRTFSEVSTSGALLSSRMRSGQGGR